MKDAVLTCSLCAERRPIATRLFAFCPECGKEIRRSVPARPVDASAPAFVAAVALPEPVISHAMVVPTATVVATTTADRRATGIRRRAVAVATVAVVAAVSGIAVWKTGTPETSGTVRKVSVFDRSTGKTRTFDMIILRTFTQDGKNCEVVKETYHHSESGQTFSEEHTRCADAEGHY